MYRSFAFALYVRFLLAHAMRTIRFEQRPLCENVEAGMGNEFRFFVGDRLIFVGIFMGVYGLCCTSGLKRLMIFVPRQIGQRSVNLRKSRLLLQHWLMYDRYFAFVRSARQSSHIGPCVRSFSVMRSFIGIAPPLFLKHLKALINCYPLIMRVVRIVL